MTGPVAANECGPLTNIGSGPLIRCGIRTHETPKGLLRFQLSAFDHSANLPHMTFRSGGSETVGSCLASHARVVKGLVPIPPFAKGWGIAVVGYAFALCFVPCSGWELRSSMLGMQSSIRAIVDAINSRWVCAKELGTETRWSVVSAPSLQMESTLARYRSMAIHPVKTDEILVSSSSPRSAAESIDLKLRGRRRMKHLSSGAISSINFKLSSKLSLTYKNSTRSPLLITFFLRVISRTCCSRDSRALARKVKMIPPKPTTPIIPGRTKSLAISYHVHAGGFAPKMAVMRADQSIARVFA